MPLSAEFKNAPKDYSANIQGHLVEYQRHHVLATDAINKSPFLTALVEKALYSHADFSINSVGLVGKIDGIPVNDFPDRLNITAASSHTGGHAAYNAMQRKIFDAFDQAYFDAGTAGWDGLGSEQAWLEVQSKKVYGFVGFLKTELTNPNSLIKLHGKADLQRTDLSSGETWSKFAKTFFNAETLEFRTVIKEHPAYIELSAASGMDDPVWKKYSASLGSGSAFDISTHNSPADVSQALLASIGIRPDTPTLFERERISDFKAALANGVPAFILGTMATGIYLLTVQHAEAHGISVSEALVKLGTGLDEKQIAAIAAEAGIDIAASTVLGPIGAAKKGWDLLTNTDDAIAAIKLYDHLYPTNPAVSALSEMAYAIEQSEAYKQYKEARDEGVETIASWPEFVKNWLQTEGHKYVMTLAQKSGEPATFSTSDSQDIRFKADGSTEERIFDPATGEISTSSTTHPDGSRTELIFSSEGSQVRQRQYNPNGVLTAEKVVDRRSSTLRFEAIFHPDGTRVETEFDADGKYSKQREFDKNGNLTASSEFNPDGSWRTTWYDVNDLYRWERSISTYSASGRQAGEQQFNDNGTEGKVAFDPALGGVRFSGHVTVSGKMTIGSNGVTIEGGHPPSVTGSVNHDIDVVATLAANKHAAAEIVAQADAVKNAARGSDTGLATGSHAGPREAADANTKTQDTQGPNLLHVVGKVLDGVGSITDGLLGGLGALLGGLPAQEKVTKKQQEAEERRLQAQADKAKRDADQEALLKKLHDLAFEVMHKQGTFNDMVASETIFADEDKPAEKGDAEQPVPGQPGRGRPKVGIPAGTPGSDRGGFMDKQGPLIGLEKKTDHKAEIPATQPNNQCSGVPGAASLADGSTLLSPICIDAEPPEDDVPGVPYVDNDAPDKQADTKAETDRLKAERAAQEAAAKAAAEAAQQAADEQRRRADEARRQREQNLRDAQERQRQMQEQSRREAEERRRQAAADQARRQAEADRLQREMASIRIPGSGGGRHPAPGAPTPAHRPSLPPSRTWFGVPVVLDLNNDNGLNIRPLDNDARSISSAGDHHPDGGTEAAEAASIGPAFDWNGDGLVDPTAWVGPDDGLLAIDLAADGTAGPDKQINQAPEIAFALWKTEDERQAELKALGIDDTGRPVTDLEGLRFAFDTNKDNVLDNRDARWSEFRIWQDANQNGVAEDSELQTLDDLGIKLINLIPSPDGSQMFADGSAITGTSTAQRTDGSSLLIGDVTLAYRPSAFG